MHNVGTRWFVTLALTAVAFGLDNPVAHAQSAGKVSFSDIDIFACYSYDHVGRLVSVVEADSREVVIDGDITDEISAESAIQEVAVIFQPGLGYEHRVRFRNADRSTWGAWSAWTTSRLEHDVPVPGAGATRADEYEMELRPKGTSPTIASHGYIRIKKLNSGG